MSQNGIHSRREGMTPKLFAVLALMFAISAPAWSAVRWSDSLRQPEKWYASPEARAIADKVLLHQTVHGGWPKNTDMTTPPSAAEAAKLRDKLEKLRGVLGGMRRMRRAPGMVFVIDPSRETLAAVEANKLGIPVVGTADTNVNPDQLQYPIPVNDDAIKCIKLICKAVADAVIEGAAERAAAGRRDQLPHHADHCAAPVASRSGGRTHCRQ
jgi:hypothetical protein